MNISFRNVCAQGDLMLRRIDKLPNGITPAKIENGVYVVAHSETGANHEIQAKPNVKVFSSVDPLVSYLEVIEATDAAETLLEHLRSFDTHETIRIPPGIFEIRRQREWVPAGWRQVAD